MTHAGKRVLKARWDLFPPMYENIEIAILAIEAEAVEAERQRIREAVNDIPSVMVGWHQGLTRQSVLDAIDGGSG